MPRAGNDTWDAFEGYTPDADGAGDGGTFRNRGSQGGYHHRGGLPPQGHIYNPDGSLVSTNPYWSPPDNPDGDGTGSTKRARQGRRGRKRGNGVAGRGKRARKPKAIHVRPPTSAGNGAGSAGRPTQAYPAASSATGGALAVAELDALAEVGLSAVLAELVGHGRVTLAHVLTASQREQDRITNRTWRRPGGLARPAGL
jgi:hypothetical protein